MGAGCVLTKQAARQEADQHECANADNNTGGYAGEDQEGKIQKQLSRGYNDGGDQQLAEVVCHAAAHADADHGEPSGTVQQIHDEETDKAPGHGIEHAVEAGEQKACNDHADQVDGKCVTGAHLIQCKYDHQISEAELNARNARLERKDGHQIGER